MQVLLAAVAIFLAAFLGYRVGWRHGARFSGTCTRTLLTLRTHGTTDAEALERRFALFH